MLASLALSSDTLSARSSRFAWSLLARSLASCDFGVGFRVLIRIEVSEGQGERGVHVCERENERKREEGERGREREREGERERGRERERAEGGEGQRKVREREEHGWRKEECAESCGKGGCMLLEGGGGKRG